VGEGGREGGREGGNGVVSMSGAGTKPSIYNYHPAQRNGTERMGKENTSHLFHLDVLALEQLQDLHHAQTAVCPFKFVQDVLGRLPADEAGLALFEGGREG